MKIMIDYDFIDAIKDVNEKFGPMKIIRNKKGVYLKLSIPSLALFTHISFKDDFISKFPLELFIYAVFDSLFEVALYKHIGDIYKNDSTDKIVLLISLLKKLNINTNLELIKKSYCYHKIYNLNLNIKKIPQIIESKYIVLPSYDYKGDIVDTSILQEHVIGQNKYSLSIGEPQKVFKLAYKTI